MISTISGRDRVSFSRSLSASLITKWCEVSIKEQNLLFNDVFPLGQNLLTVGILLVEDSSNLIIDDLVRLLRKVLLVT